MGNKFGDFSLAFQPIYPPEAVEDCPDISAKASEGRVQDKHITLNNFGKVPNECELKEVLSSHTVIVVITGNTYPRWPVVPDNFFFTFYKAKRELVEMLPYNVNDGPGTVVHLREVSLFYIAARDFALSSYSLAKVAFSLRVLV